ncbi:hypothetical protein L9F63_008580 [Diploptera punctata]|uniref:CRAL-TRIO domain-containing protein n=1 Tax=Diploptera punctata TaxID=6984 RepID=A0AAD7Z4Q3_DIPPU|nr:hypothetical protein L9F63_008580 [Diploptera punctata]
MAGEEDVLHIQSWLKSQPHLPPISDKQVKLFLHSCLLHLEETKKTIDTYYTLKTNTPEFFSSRNPLSDEIQHIKNVIQLAVLPKKSPEGYTMIVGRLKDPDPSHYVYTSTVKLLFMVVDAILQTEGPLSGLVYVFDMQGGTLSHVTKANLSSVRKYFTYSQEGMPVRLKAIHIVNVNPVITHIMNLAKQFMSKERIKMIHLHTGITDEFLQAVPRSLLPRDYTGDEPLLDDLFKDTLRLLEDCKHWFMQDEKLKVDESKRERGHSSTEEFGVAGSFKKLEID